MSKTIGQLVVRAIAEHDVEELALGFLRYETLRRMNPNQFKELNQRNLAGERFDDIVTEELLKWKGGKL
jgi:hypothetical protein